MDIDEPVPEADPSPDGLGTEVPSASEVSASVISEAESPSDGPSVRTSRRLVIGVVVAVVIIAAGIGLAFALSSTPTTLSTGTGTATITWTPVPTGSDGASERPQPFDGTIQGIIGSGVATTPLIAGGAKSNSPTGAIPTKLELAKWKGTFGGKAFAVTVSAQYAPGTSFINPSAPFPTITIVGRWGTDPVNARVDTPTAAELKSATSPLDFHGTVGSFKVVGTVHPPTGRSPRQSLATFTVTQ